MELMIIATGFIVSYYMTTSIYAQMGIPWYFLTAGYLTFVSIWGSISGLLFLTYNY